MEVVKKFTFTDEENEKQITIIIPEVSVSVHLPKWYFGYFYHLSRGKQVAAPC